MSSVNVRCRSPIEVIFYLVAVGCLLTGVIIKKETLVYAAGFMLVSKFMFDLVFRFRKGVAFTGPLGVFERLYGKQFVIVFMWIVSACMLLVLAYKISNT